MVDVQFSPGHVWARVDGDVAVLGLTDYLQDQLGDIRAINLPDVADVLRARRRFAELESDDAKTVVESPVSGEVIEVNPDLLATPDLVNEEPYEGGWLVKVRLDDPSELQDLMSEEEYMELTTEV